MERRLDQPLSRGGDGVFAVLTGDIIGSTGPASPPMEQTRALTALAAERLKGLAPGAAIGAPEFFRGDSWQLLLGDPRWALRAALLIRATLRAELATDTRIAIGLGAVDHIDPARISLSRGEAFVLSGRALDRMTGYFQLTGALPLRAGALALWLPATLHLCSGVIASWTRRQAQVVASALLLAEPTHERIAAALHPPVAKQTVTRALRGADWRALQEPLDAFEKTDWRSLAGPA
jgi:hypothetical protein